MVRSQTFRFVIAGIFLSIVAIAVAYVYILPVKESSRTNRQSDSHTPAGTQLDVPIEPLNRVAGLPSEVFAVLGSNRGRHSEAVKCLAVSPDGRWVASGSRDRTVCVWDPETLQERYVLPHPDDVDTIAFMPDSKRLLSVCWDGNLRVWTLGADSPELAATIHLDDQQPVARFSPDASILVTSISAEDQIALRVLRMNGREAIPIRDDLVGFDEFDAPKCLALSKDGRWLAAGSTVVPDGKIYIWDLKNTASKPRWVLSDPGARIESVAFDRDSQVLLAGQDYGAIVPWSLSEAEPRRKTPLLGHQSDVREVVFSPDGDRFVSGGDDHAICLWNWNNGEPVRVGKLSGHRNWVDALAFGPNGQTLYSASWDHTVRRWIAANDSFEAADDFAGHQHPVSALAFSADGSLLASGSESDIDDMEKPRSNEIHLWHFGGAQPKEDGVISGCQGRISALSFSRDGELLAAADDSGVRCWSLPTRSEVATLQHTVFPYGDRFDSPAESLAFAPRGRLLASGWSEPHVRLTDFESLPPKTVARWEPPNHHIGALAFAPDGQTIAAASSNLASVFLLNHVDGQMRLRDTLEGSAEIQGMTFSSDGIYLAAANRNGVQLWDTRADRGAQPTTLEGHEEPVTSVAFGLGGKVLASADWSGRLILWDISATKVRSSMTFPGRISSLAFAPDGEQLAIGGATGLVYMIQVKQ